MTARSKRTLNRRANAFEVWAKQMRVLLVELAKKDIGYPQAEHEVKPPSRPRVGVVEALRPMYEVFDGVSLPDVWNGYWINTSKFVAAAAARGETTQIVGKSIRTMQVFGSDGGGNAFAVDTKDEAVYYLPYRGAVYGAFRERDWGAPRRLAKNVLGFLGVLKRDVEAFVHDKPHTYIDGGKSRRKSARRR